MPRPISPALAALLLLAGCRTDAPAVDTPGADGAAPVPLEAPARGPVEPDAWFWQQRAFPQGEINEAAYHEARRQALALRAAAGLAGGTWTPAGPTNVPGRVSSLAAVSFSDVYVGTASGGLYRTTDGGATFTPLGEGVLDLSIGDVALDPSDPQTLYVGTGEANGGGGSVTYGGGGVFRSTDGGATFAHLRLEGTWSIGRIAVSPADPDRILVAAMGRLFGPNPERGVFRSTDGGATWARTLFVDAETGAVDLAVNPRSPDTVYAATWQRVRTPEERVYGGPGSGLWRSTDGGATWARLTAGLPSGPDVGRPGLTLSAADPRVLYAYFADASGDHLGHYRSADGGTTWARLNDGPVAGNSSTFGWWFGQVRADPTNPQRLFTLGLDVYRSEDGGQSWAFASGDIHVDQHALWIDPANPQRLVAGNDGGVYRSANGGASWTAAPGAFPTTQFYTVEIDASAPQRLYGGAQDNGTNRTLTGALDDWAEIYGGDGHYVLVDPSDNRYVYAEYQYGNFVRSTNGGASFVSARPSAERANWSTPVVFDPAAPATLYLGTYRVWKSTNRAVSWTPVSPDLTGGPGSGSLVYGTLTTLDVSPADPAVIWAGADDGHVHVTTDGGATWTDVSAGLPTRWVTRVTAHPTQPGTALLTLSGFREDDPLPHVFRTDDGGATWTPRVAGLPEAPANDVLFDPADPARLYLATDVGVFTSADGGGAWEAMGTGLPLVPVTDLDLHDGTRRLVAATYGRSMFAFDLTQLPTAAAPGSGPASALGISVAPNPARGPVTLRLTTDAPGEALVEVFDAAGRRVRAWEGAVPVGGRPLSWDLRDAAGRPVAAGVYVVRLRVDGRTATARVTVAR